MQSFWFLYTFFVSVFPDFQMDHADTVLVCLRDCCKLAHKQFWGLGSILRKNAKDTSETTPDKQFTLMYTSSTC